MQYGGLGSGAELCSASLRTGVIVPTKMNHVPFYQLFAKNVMSGLRFPSDDNWVHFSGQEVDRKAQEEGTQRQVGGKAQYEESV